MIDIVERLRMGGPNAMEAVEEAAREIEVLRRTVLLMARKIGADATTRARLDWQDWQKTQERCDNQ